MGTYMAEIRHILSHFPQGELAEGQKCPDFTGATTSMANQSIHLTGWNQIDFNRFDVTPHT
jgi:hypothetical protein